MEAGVGLTTPRERFPNAPYTPTCTETSEVSEVSLRPPPVSEFDAGLPLGPRFLPLDPRVSVPPDSPDEDQCLGRLRVITLLWARVRPQKRPRVTKTRIGRGSEEPRGELSAIVREKSERMHRGWGSPPS